MISKQFETEIKKYEEDLFYNTSGSIEAYRLFVRHLSYADVMNIGTKYKDVFTPYDKINIVDFENEEIIEVRDSITIIQIKNIP